MEGRLQEMEDMAARQQLEITRLADGFNSQSQMTKAIELARGGATVTEIMLTTNLPKEEAEAIARFTGPDKLSMYELDISDYSVKTDSLQLMRV